MGPVQAVKLSLRFRGDDLDPAELSRIFGAFPTSAARKGLPCRTPSGQTRVAETGWWHVKSDAPSSFDLDQHLALLFQKLSVDLSAWRELSRSYGGNLFVGLFLGSGNEGLRLGPDIAGAIAARGLELQLDIYGPDA